VVVPSVAVGETDDDSELATPIAVREGSESPQAPTRPPMKIAMTILLEIFPEYQSGCTSGVYAALARRFIGLSKQYERTLSERTFRESPAIISEKGAITNLI
jgi:hypothetical protein